MERNEELINTRYDALMFAQTPAAAKRAAKALIDAVLGDLAEGVSLEKGLREVCRRIRPASDPRDQARFEAEFLELALAPTGAQGGNSKSAEKQEELSNSANPRQRAAA